MDEENLLSYHIIHCLSILKYINIKPKSNCLDIGTGGGLPGIPISIAFPEAVILLVDSISKKIKITEMLAKHTGNKRLKAICERVENLSSDKINIGKFDFIFARAVARTKLMISWIKPLLKPDGIFVMLKGGDITEEIEDVKNSFPDLNFIINDISMLGMDIFRKDDKKIVLCSKIK